MGFRSGAIAICLMGVGGCAAARTVAVRPAVGVAPHLYFFDGGHVLHEIHREDKTVPQGEVAHDAGRTALLFRPSYVTPAVVYRIDRGRVSKAAGEAAFNAALVKLPGDEACRGEDDLGKLIFTYSEGARRIRVRDRDGERAVRYEMASAELPQALFDEGERLYLVMGNEPGYPMDLWTLPGTRPDHPRQLVVLRREADGYVEESAYTVPGSYVLDVDPWSDEVLGEEDAWMGMSPMGAAMWERNRFLFNLKTGKRTELPGESGIGNLREGYFLAEDPMLNGGEPVRKRGRR